MNTTEWTKKVADRCPHTFNRVDVDFTHTIRIVISRPFAIAMTDDSMRPVNTIIAAPSICIYTIYTGLTQSTYNLTL